MMFARKTLHAQEYRCQSCGRAFANASDLQSHGASCAASQRAPDVQERIRRRAYEIYLERGGNGGSAEQDWLRAEREILGARRSA